MSDAVAVAVAKAVTSQIDAATLSLAFTPERSYADWELALEDADELHVDVVVVTTELATELSSRGRMKYTVPIDIGVRKRFVTAQQDDDTGRVELAEVDALMLLVEEIHELFASVSLTDYTEATWQETKTLVAPLNKHLRENRQFTGIVRVTFRVDKAIA